MNTVELTALRRRYFLITLLTWLPLGMGVAGMVLLVTARGFDLAAVGVLFLVQGLVVTGLELPTGGLSDVIGRRGVLMASAVIGVAAMVWSGLATGWWELIAATVLRGVARALSTGPAEAWYVDAVHAVDPDADIRRGLASGNTATSLGLGLGTIAGGVIPLLTPLAATGLVIPLSIPMFVSAACFAALLVTVALGMTEPARTERPGFGAVLRGVPATITNGFRLSGRDRGLLRLLLLAVFGGVSLNAVELLTPGRMEALAGGAEAGAGVYGVVAMIGFVASGLGSTLSHRLTRLVGDNVRAAAVIGVAVSVSGLVLLFATGTWTGTVGIVGAASGYALMFVGIGLRMPVTSELIHRRVTSEERATVVSIQSLLLQGGGSLATVALPLLAAAWSVPGAWLMAGLVLAASALLYRRTRADRGLDAEAPSPAVSVTALADAALRRGVRFGRPALARDPADPAVGGRPAVSGTDVDVVVVAREAGTQDAVEAVVAGLLGQRAEAVAAGQVGGRTVQVLAVGGTTDGAVARGAAEAAGHGDRLVAQGVPQGLQLPHRHQRVGLGGGRRDLAAAPVAVALVQLGVGEVDRGVVGGLKRVDLVVGVGAGDAVGAEAVGALEPFHRRLGRGAEGAVQRQYRAVAGVTGDPDLKLPDVLSAHTVFQGARP